MLDLTIAKHKKSTTGGVQAPSEALLSTWRKGDNDMEASAKMLALIDYLKEWEPSGDKTICYSQCKPVTSPHVQAFLNNFIM